MSLVLIYCSVKLGPSDFVSACDTSLLVPLTEGISHYQQICRTEREKEFNLAWPELVRYSDDSK